MSRKGYSDETRLRAKAMWITGQGTDAQIAERLGIQRPETIGEWRRSGGWDRERELVQQITEERVSQAVAETISEMNSRHLKTYQLMQSKGLQALRRLDPQRAAEAQAMIDTGVKGERLVRGEPTEVREVRALMKANVQVLELVVADVLKVLLEAGSIDQRAAKRFAELFASRVNEAPFRYVTEGS
jgi:transposase-like protein